MSRPSVAFVMAGTLLVVLPPPVAEATEPVEVRATPAAECVRQHQAPVVDYP